MIDLLGKTSGTTALSLFNLMDMLNKVVDAESFDGGHTSHTTQNN